MEEEKLRFFALRSGVFKCTALATFTKSESPGFIILVAPPGELVRSVVVPIIICGTVDFLAGNGGGSEGLQYVQQV